MKELNKNTLNITTETDDEQRRAGRWFAATVMTVDGQRIFLGHNNTNTSIYQSDDIVYILRRDDDSASLGYVDLDWARNKLSSLDELCDPEWITVDGDERYERDLIGLPDVDLIHFLEEFL